MAWEKYPKALGMTTFTLTGSSAILGAIVFLNHVEHLVALFLKCASLISLLMAWYWISAKDDCRAATDALFMAGLKAVVMVCCCFCSFTWGQNRGLSLGAASPFTILVLSALPFPVLALFLRDVEPAEHVKLVGGMAAVLVRRVTVRRFSFEAFFLLLMSVFALYSRSDVSCWVQNHDIYLVGFEPTTCVFCHNH